MSAKFSTGVRFNHNLGVLETWSFIGEGVGAVLYLAGYASGARLLEMLGVGFLILAVIVLRQHLGQPTRGWRAVSKLGNAWVSRGTLVIATFTGTAAASVLAGYVDLLRPFESLLSGVSVVVAVPVIIYAGMLLRSMRAIRLWRGPFMPLAFPAHSAATGLTIGYGLLPFAGVAAPGWFLPAAIAALVAAAAVSALHLAQVEKSAGTDASLRRLFSGDLKGQFVAGAGVAGLGVPLAALLLAALLSPGSGLATATGVVAALLRLYGDYAYRLSVVTAGAYEPVFPTHEQYFGSRTSGRSSARAA